MAVTHQEADAAHKLQGGPPPDPGVVEHQVAGDGCVDDPDQGNGQGGDDGGSVDLQARREVVLLFGGGGPAAASGGQSVLLF